MDPEFFAKVQAAAAASVSMGTFHLPPLILSWRLRDGLLEILWPNGSTWIQYRPQGDVSTALVGNLASEAIRRMNQFLGDDIGPFLCWPLKNPENQECDGKAEFSCFFLAESLMNPAPDLSIDIRVLPPA